MQSECSHAVGEVPFGRGTACQGRTANDGGGEAATPSCATDPRNLIPTNLNTSASMNGVAMDLSQTRQSSTIPKTGSGHAGEQYVWQYPSHLQLFNALKRKDKEVDATDIPAFTFVHNRVNERTWNQVLKCEALHSRWCSSPSLTRFVGRYDSPSIKGRFMSHLTHLDDPFDRHDWYVNRCGHQIRYVVDFYHDSKATDDLQIYIDARPALDSPRAVWDRARLALRGWLVHGVGDDKT